jgi:hypothetical protein
MKAAALPQIRAPGIRFRAVKLGRRSRARGRAVTVASAVITSPAVF